MLVLHPKTELYVFAHVDDMMCIGDEVELEHFKMNLEKKYKLTSTYLGPKPSGTVRGVIVSDRTKGEEVG